MKAEIISQILTILSTMKGYPGMSPQADPDAAMDPVKMVYFSFLAGLTDEAGCVMRRSVLLRYDERPSVKQLRDWAIEISASAVQVPTFLAGSVASARLTEGEGPQTPGRTAAALLTQAARHSAGGGHPIPHDVKEFFRGLKEREKRGHLALQDASPADRGDWGLEYLYPEGRTERYPARHSEEVARQRAAEIAAKFSHFRVRVYTEGGK